jgi:hypothetical protein
MTYMDKGVSHTNLLTDFYKNYMKKRTFRLSLT